MDKIAYIDFDGTAINAKLRMAEVYNLYYRALESPIIDGRQISTWDAGIPPHLVEIIFSDERFFSKLEVFDGFENAMNMLKDIGFKIVLYTKGSLLNIASKAEWVALTMDDIFDGWHFVGTNDLVMGKSQLDMSVENGYSILIDDHQKNLKPSIDAHISNMPTYSICCRLAERKDEAWNSNWNGKVINHWNDLERLIKKIDNYETNVIR